jgi:hypothetical protein
MCVRTFIWVCGAFLLTALFLFPLLLILLLLLIYLSTCIVGILRGLRAAFRVSADKDGRVDEKKILKKKRKKTRRNFFPKNISSIT